METKRFASEYIEVTVPDGWLAFYGINSEGDLNPKTVHICKDAKTEFDLFSKVCITVCYYGKDDSYFLPRSFYDNVKDISPFDYCGRVWDAFTCTSFSYPYTMLEGAFGEHRLLIMMLMQNGEHSISISDADVMTVIESIKFIR